MNPEPPVQRQLEAYNARDLERFLAEYDDAVLAFRPPAGEPALAGKAAFAAFYQAERFNRPQLHAELVNRMVFGNTVIDHERIFGVREEPFEVAVVYKVVDGLIACTWSFPAA
jgi:hypothetical protein